MRIHEQPSQKRGEATKTKAYWAESMLEGVRKGRHMPFLKRGMLVDVAGEKGRIVGGNDGMNIDVRFGKRYIGNCHPTWETTYYGEDGTTIIADYKKMCDV